MLVVLHRLLYVTFFWRVAISYRQEIKCFHVDNMKQIFQDIHIDSIMTFLKEINLFNKILILLLFKFVYCQLNMLFFIFLNSIIGRLTLYSAHVKNMYSCLNSSLKLSDIVHDLSSRFKLITIINFMNNIFFYFSHPIMTHKQQTNKCHSQGWVMF